MKLLATLGAFVFSGIVAAAPLHDVVVFGDSLSDNGNLYEFMKRQLPQSPPYYEGRFSNGPVWIERLMEQYYPSNVSEHLFDYAFGGAGVSEEEDDDSLFTLKREVKTYLLAHGNVASEDSLYVVWIGANNYLGMPDEVEKTLKSVNDGIVHSLQSLVDKGAKHFLIVNIPDLGKTPAATEFNAVDMLTYYSQKHNEMLLNSVNQLRQEYPKAQWHFYDMGSMFDEMIKNPAEFGVTNVSGTCYNSLVDRSIRPSMLKVVANVQRDHDEEECPGYLFFDLVHPTSLAHKVMADRVKILFANEGIEFTQ